VLRALLYWTKLAGTVVLLRKLPLMEAAVLLLAPVAQEIVTWVSDT